MKMDTGTGIAIAGVWSIVAAAFFAKEVTGLGLCLALVVAIGMTLILK
jgi:hypothetical protein